MGSSGWILIPNLSTENSLSITLLKKKTIICTFLNLFFQITTTKTIIIPNTYKTEHGSFRFLVQLDLMV